MTILSNQTNYWIDIADAYSDYYMACLETRKTKYDIGVKR